MNAPRLRRVVSVTVIAATAGTAAAIGSHPFPNAAPPALAPQVAASDPQARLVAREARARARLRLAERRLRAVAAQSTTSAPAATFASAPAPIVSVAPAPVAAVTQSASS